MQQYHYHIIFIEDINDMINNPQSSNDPPLMQELCRTLVLVSQSLTVFRKRQKLPLYPLGHLATVTNAAQLLIFRLDRKNKKIMEIRYFSSHTMIRSNKCNCY
jgi:hypothetical protein